jgi:hypothetical protein
VTHSVKIEAEFGSGVFTWGGSASYVDLTSRAFSFSISRGRSDYSQPFQAGTCTVTFRNQDGVLDPDNTAGTYYGRIQPGRRLRIVSNPGNMLYERIIYVGFITDIQLSYDLSGEAIVTMTAADGLSLLAQQSISDGTAVVQQTTGDRFNAIIGLSEVDYPFLVSLGIGQSICAAGTAEGNVLSYLEKVTQTEQGAIFVDRSGTLQFRNRYELLNASTWTFSDDGAATNYEAITRLVTALELYNRLQANRTGEDPVVRDSSTSKGQFGVRFLNLGEVLFNTDGEVTDMLDFAMVRFASTSPRIAEVTTLLDSKGQLTVANLVQLELTDSVTVEFTPPGVSQITVPCIIESVRHDFTVGGGWRLTFGFTPRDTSNYLVLDDAVLGALDANVLAF